MPRLTRKTIAAASSVASRPARMPGGARGGGGGLGGGDVVGLALADVGADLLLRLQRDADVLVGQRERGVARRRCRRASIAGKSLSLTDASCLRSASVAPAASLVDDRVVQRLDGGAGLLGGVDARLPLALVARLAGRDVERLRRPAAGACPRPGSAAPSTATSTRSRARRRRLACDDFCRTTASDASITARTPVKASPSLAPSRRRRGERMVAWSSAGHADRVERCEVVSADPATSAAGAAIMGGREACRALDPPRGRLRRDTRNSRADRGWTTRAPSRTTCWPRNRSSPTATST